MKHAEELSAIRAMDKKSIREKIEGLERELMSLRFRSASAGQLEKPSELARLRKQIARVHTILREQANS